MASMSFSLLFLLLLFIFLFSPFPSFSSTQCHPDEHSALLQLKSSFSVVDPSLANCVRLYENGTIYLTMSSWNKNTNCCEWDGVTCDNITGHVIGLDLSCSRLKGIIHPNSSLFSLCHLQSLDLSFNAELRIGADAFKALAMNLTNLRELSLSHGSDLSTVPLVSLMNLSSSLTSLELHSCQLHGELPQNIFQSHKLQSLDLGGNLLNGTIPSWIFELPYLVNLNIGLNLLTGEIRNFHSTSLQDLSLGGNELHGVIPRSIFQQVKLQYLDLSSNDFTVNIDLEDLSKLKELGILDLSSNNISWSFNSSKNYTLNNLLDLGLSSCNLIEFPLFLKSMKRLGSLDLSSNQLHGSVPKWLWEVGKDSFTFLDLSHNSLTYLEPLPWNNMYILDLSFNLFSGPLPVSSSPRLVYFSASRNHFLGEIPLSICSMTSLLVLELSTNNLSGNIPPCFENLISSRLWVLDLRNNRFHGMIPPFFSKGNSLGTLNLNGNQLEGSLPQSLLNCENLEVLDIGDNKINGPFPQWLESLPKLEVLILRSNRFSGPINNPKVRFPFQNLRIMDLSNNEFTGHLPTKYFENFMAMMDAHMDDLEYKGSGTYYQDSVVLVIKGFELQLEKILTVFTTIDFSRNNFEGEIPMSLGKLRSLKGLNFSHNKLVGLIPQSLQNLTNLEGLDLSSNGLSGEIPSKLADLVNLVFLNLSWNKLAGPIPRGNQFQTFGNDSYIGNVGLCGFPLSKTCSIEGAQQPSPSNSKHEDKTFDWKILLMGLFGCGVVIGISTGYMVKRSSKRNAHTFVEMSQSAAGKCMRGTSDDQKQ